MTVDELHGHGLSPGHGDRVVFHEDSMAAGIASYAAALDGAHERAGRGDLAI